MLTNGIFSCRIYSVVKTFAQKKACPPNPSAAFLHLTQTFARYAMTKKPPKRDDDMDDLEEEPPLTPAQARRELGFDLLPFNGGLVGEDSDE